MMESVEEVLTPSIIVTPNTVNATAEEAEGTITVTYNNIKWTVDTFDFDNRFTGYIITAVYPNGMVVSIHAKCTNSYKSRINSYLKDLERSIRLEDK